MVPSSGRKRRKLDDDEAYGDVNGMRQFRQTKKTIKVLVDTKAESFVLTHDKKQMNAAAAVRKMVADIGAHDELASMDVEKIVADASAAQQHLQTVSGSIGKAQFGSDLVALRDQADAEIAKFAEKFGLLRDVFRTLKDREHWDLNCFRICFLECGGPPQPDQVVSSTWGASRPSMRVAVCFPLDASRR